MSNDPDQIRREIAATRAGLSDDVNELSDKVSPSHIARRQTARVKGTVTNVKNHIMGSATDTKDAASGVISDAGEAVRNAPGKVAQQTQGNPLAAGLVAFGVGALLSALFPASQAEAQAAVSVKDKAQPLVEGATAAAKEVAGNLQEPAQEAVESVKSTATDAVDTVKDETTSAASDVKDQAQDAKESVQHAGS